MGTEETPPIENQQQEVNKPVAIKGKVRLGLDQLSNPTPLKWKRVSNALKFFFTGLITIFSASSLVGPKTANIINLCISIAILALGALDMGLGVGPVDPAANRNKKDN